MDIWMTTLALGGMIVLAVIVAGALGSRPARPMPSTGRRGAIALALVLAFAGAAAIVLVWLLHMLA